MRGVVKAGGCFCVRPESSRGHDREKRNLHQRTANTRPDASSHITVGGKICREGQTGYCCHVGRDFYDVAGDVIETNHLTHCGASVVIRSISGFRFVSGGRGLPSQPSSFLVCLYVTISLLALFSMCLIGAIAIRRRVWVAWLESRVTKSWTAQLLPAIGHDVTQTLLRQIGTADNSFPSVD